MVVPGDQEDARLQELEDRMSKSENGSVKTVAANWLARQETNTVILILILGFGCFIMYYLVMTGIPAHLQAIHFGYKEIDTANRQAREDESKRHETAILQLSQERQRDTDRLVEAIKDANQNAIGAFDRAISQQQKAFENGIRAGAEAAAYRAGKRDAKEKEDAPD